MDRNQTLKIAEQLLIHNKELESTNQYVNRVSLDLKNLLDSEGKFILHENILYYFHRKSFKTYRFTNTTTLIGNSFLIFLIQWLGLAVSDLHAKKILDRIFSLSLLDAKNFKLHHLSYYNKTKNILYVRKSNTKWFKVSSKKISIVSNGTDNIFMKDEFNNINLKESGLSLQDLNNENDSSYLSKYIFSLPNFNKDQISKSYQETIYKLWTLSLFFKEILPTKPILVFVGDAGSGKTSAIQNVGKLVFGDNFYVAGMSKDERDFLSHITHNHLVAIDNVDETLPDWFADKIAGIATGMGFTMRTLYTDVSAPPTKVKPESFIALTSRTPRFNRDDVADRCIVLSLDRIKNFKQPEIDRDIAFCYLLKDLQKVLQNFEKNKIVSNPVNLRMVDFSNFCLKAVKIEARETILKMFESIKDSQNEFASENNPTLDAIIDLSTKKPGLYEMKSLHQKLFDEYNLTYKNTYHLGRLLSTNAGLLRKSIKFVKTKKGGKIYYQIGEFKEIDNTKLVEQTLL